ncbi:SMP-30/gluconolactonase/LRE family protein [Haloechinothrix halophila]|uniref:SMP-30/gluconolactonase/LRE family protein n=1 Tax=Haloechinothrix halophila TaxID=1069073 RepID=UPI000421504A|nr:SMP-30/gluconolactonase/LRE family protein [Haloechinothrix halophila]
MSFQSATVIPVNGEGTEDVLVDKQGRIYTGLTDGRVLRVDNDGSTIETIATCPGRPLGLEFYGDDDLVVCASDAGLLAVSLSSGAVRVLADTVFDAPILACNNAAVASDGTIYFSDSSRRYPIPEWRTDLIEQTRTGRLLRRNPDGTVDELLTGLHFANGVALAADESFVTVAESGACQVRRFWLTGQRAGTADLFVGDLSGYPDNSSTGSDGLIWIAIPAPRNPALGVVQKLPGLVRSAVTKLPESLQPAPSKTMRVIGVDDRGDIVHSYEGEIDGFHMLTGVRERDAQLYFGSLLENAVVTMAR